MNEMTLFLAQVFGPTLFIVSLGMILNPKFYMKALQDFTNSPLGLIGSSIGLIAVGMVLVMKHFLWGSLTEIIVSILGLATLIKGILLAVMPQMMIDISRKFVSYPSYLTFAGYA